jgi:maltooligosyltrehalose trehalohydrolase
VRYWIEEFHFDGLRVDATQVIHSTTPIHVLKEIAECAKVAGGKRKIIVIGENEAQESILLRTSSEGGYEFDALWNDDFHHSAIVKLTGKREAYYSDYSGHCQELLSCLKHGFLYQGQYYSWQKKYRGSSTLGLHPKNFVLFLQNHDQIANSGKGSRIHELAHPGNYKAMTCLMLIAPGTPLLFQGQEFASSSCFVYFADHDYKLSKLIDRGRKEFLSQFPHITDKKVLSQLPNPANVEVFLKSKLDFSEREKNAPLYKLHQDLIALRKSDPIFSHADPLFDGAVLSNDTFLIRYFADKHDRLLLFNFAGDFEIKPLSCPLLALPQGCKWKLLWSSESTDYGGQGTPPLDDTTWIVPAHSALILQCKEC